MKNLIYKILKENKEDIYHKEDIYLKYIVNNFIDNHVIIERSFDTVYYSAFFKFLNGGSDIFSKEDLFNFMNDPLSDSVFDKGFIDSLKKYGVSNLDYANLLWKMISKEIIRRIVLLEKSKLNESDNSKRDKFIKVIANDIFSRTYYIKTRVIPDDVRVFNIGTPFGYTLSNSWFKKPKSERTIERTFILKFYRYVSDTYGVDINDGYFIEKVMSIYFELLTDAIMNKPNLNESTDFIWKIKNNIYRYLDRKYEVYYPKYFRQSAEYDWAIRSKDGSKSHTLSDISREIVEIFDLDIHTSLDLSKIWVGRNLKVLNEKQRNINEDVPIYKEHNLGKKMYQRLRKAYPMTPEYVLKDYFYNNIVNEFDTIQKDYYGDPVLATRGYWDSYLKGPWKLQILTVNPEDFDDRTVNAFLERDFGNIDTYQVPDDKERTKIQRRLAKPSGMNEPVIVELKPDGKYELIEGWHRTMSILLLGDNGEDLKNWDKVKIRAFVRYPNH